MKLQLGRKLTTCIISVRWQKAAIQKKERNIHRQIAISSMNKQN